MRVQPGYGGTGASPSSSPGKAMVTPPIPLRMVDPEVPPDIRPAAGIVKIHLQIDTNGLPINVHTVDTVTGPLSKSAVRAAEQYRFWPAIKDGEPVRVDLSIDVNFR